MIHSIELFQTLDQQGECYPNGFQYQPAIQDFHASGLHAALNQYFNYQTKHDELSMWPVIQDATFYVQFLLRQWHPLQLEARLDVRVSNFGKLVGIMALDAVEPDTTIEQVFDMICQRHGYQYVPTADMYLKWLNRHGQQTTAWQRFFDYV